jgi:hypothetical protein
MRSFTYKNVQYLHGHEIRHLMKDVGHAALVEDCYMGTDLQKILEKSNYTPLFPADSPFCKLKIFSVALLAMEILSK